MNPLPTSDNSLKTRLIACAAAWTAEAVRYRSDLPPSRGTENSLWFGMSFAFEDSAEELLELLNEPSVQLVFAFIEVLEQRRVLADQVCSHFPDQLHLQAYTSGAAEGYRTCADHLANLLIERMLATNTRVDYPS